MSLTHEDLLRDEHGADIHGWFGLTYSNYLVLPRSLMQSMPGDWQRRMVECLQEMDDHFGDRAMAHTYWVRAADARGGFIRDPAPPYDRGRAFVPGRSDA